MTSNKKDISGLSDEELIVMILESGEMELFGHLYDRYGNKVFRKVISMLKDKETSKDVTQEILVKSFLSLSKFEGKSKFSTWLYMVTYNACIDHIRKKKRSILVESELTDDGMLAYEDTLYEKEILELDIERLEEVLELIPVEDKSILLMFYQDDMSIKDLTDYLDVGASAVKMRLSRARSKLKNIYDTKYKVEE